MEKLSKFWIYCFLILFSLVPILFVEMPIWITLISIILIIFICTKFNIKKFPIIIFILSFLIRLIFNLLVDTQPVSDFGGLYNASKLLLNGNTSYNKLPYFISYPYQIGFVSYQTILLKICNSLLFLKITNCIISSLIVVLIYLISKEFVKEKNAQIVSIIYSLMPFTISYTSV